MRKLFLPVFALSVYMAIAGATTLSAVFADTEVSINDVPEAVRATILEHVGQGQILEMELETENGQSVYDVEFRLNGDTAEFQVSETGQYLGPEAEENDDDDNENDGDGDGEDESEVVVEGAQVPQAVQTAITTALGGAAPGDVTREMEGGFTYYEAEYEAGGVERTIKLTEDGNVIESEEEVVPASLPAAVAEAIEGEIKEAELVTVTFYEIEVKHGERVREVKVFSNGDIIGGDDDDNDDNHDDDEDDDDDNDDERDHNKGNKKRKSAGRSGE